MTSRDPRRPLGRALAVVLACAPIAVSACRSGRDASEVRRCPPRAEHLDRSDPAPVRRVALYWDVSRTMAVYASGGTGHPAGALHKLWRDLAPTWVRPDGSDVTAVTQWQVGETIRALPRARGDPEPLPALSDAWTALPELAARIAEELRESDDVAALVVSDMVVDVPPPERRRTICNGVQVPSDSGLVPTMFAQCLAAPWEGGLPPWLTLRAVRIAAPVPQAKAGHPLFVLLLTRNPDYARQVAAAVAGGVSAHEPRELALLEHRPILECGASETCTFRAQPGIVNRHAAGGTCSFLAPRSRVRHALRCAFEPLEPGDALVGPVLAVQASEGASASFVAAEGERAVRAVDLRTPLEGLRGGGPRDVGWTATCRWRLRPDAAERLGRWLEGAGDAREHEALFHSSAIRLATLADRSCACATRWTVRYER